MKALQIKNNWIKQQSIMSICFHYVYSILRERIIRISVKYFIFYLLVSKKHPFLLFTILSDLTCLHYLRFQNCFELNYNLLSLVYNSRFRYYLSFSFLGIMYSIYKIFYNAKWWEAEIWDMFGIIFLNHLGLYRVLTDYNFQGHPLRKEFPIQGFIESTFWFN